MTIQKGKLLVEGTDKKIYSASDESLLILHFKDDVLSANGKETGTIKKKGEINADISAKIFQYLETYHIPTHFVEAFKTRELLVKSLDMLSVQVKIRNIASGRFCRKYGIKEGTELVCPILEFYVKDSALKFPMATMDHLIALEFAKNDEIQTMDRYARKANAVLRSYFERRNIQLVDITFEFGKIDNDILLGDEISLNTMRLFDKETHEKLGSDRLTLNEKDVQSLYQEIGERIIT